MMLSAKLFAEMIGFVRKMEKVERGILRKNAHPVKSALFFGKRNLNKALGSMKIN